jgi:hypothetical protein
MGAAVGRGDEWRVAGVESGKDEEVKRPREEKTKRHRETFP